VSARTGVPRTILIVLSVFLGGCQFQTLDIRRPLSVGGVPDVEALRSVYEGRNLDEEALRRSLDRTREAASKYGIHRYDEIYSFTSTNDLANALNFAPENPYAWIQLGAQLALEHQADAAIRATENGLAIMDDLCAQKRCPTELDELRAIGQVNLGIYFASADRPFEAVLALSEVSPDTLLGVEKLAYYWAMVNISLQGGDADEAQKFLTTAIAVPGTDEPLPPTKTRRLFAGRHEQFYGNARKGNEHFLQALICASPEKHDRNCAESEIQQALDIFPELWDAHILRANLQYEDGKYDAAIATLQAIMKRNPKRMIFHFERVSFNLGNAYLAQYQNAPNGGSPEDLAKAVAAFQEAANIVARRATEARVQARYADVIEQPERVSSFFIAALDDVPAVYSDALNNLGEVQLLLGNAEPTVEKRLARYRTAERHWREALQEKRWPRRHLAWTNLARVYCLTGEIRSALEAADESLEEDPYNIAALEALARIAAEAPDVEVPSQVAEGIARLVWMRQDRYEPGTFDAMLQPLLDRLSRVGAPYALPRPSAIGMLQLALARREQRLDLIRELRTRFSPDWLAIQEDILRIDEIATEAGEAAAERLLAKPHVPGDWWERSERADAYILLAASKFSDQKDEEARADIERALGHGADASLLRIVADPIDAKLANSKLPATRSIAVTPFRSLYSENGNEWPHGLAWAISSGLQAAGISARYVDRNKAGAYAHDVLAPAEIGRRVGAGAVLSGWMAVTRKKVILGLTLTDPISGSQRVLDRIEESPERLATLTSTIVRRVLEQIRFDIPASLDENIGEALTDDDEAYIAYLDGLQAILPVADPTVDALEKARTAFITAVDEDRDFALAHAWLARVRQNLASGSRTRSAELQAALDDAKRAVELEAKRHQESAQTRSARAELAAWYEWDFDLATKTFEHATTQIDPGDAHLHRAFGTFLMARGKFEQALEEKSAALALEPHSAAAHLGVGWPLFYLRRFDEAAQQARDARTRDANLYEAHELLAAIHLAEGRDLDALVECVTVPERHRSPGLIAQDALFDVKSGMPEYAERKLRELERAAPDDLLFLHRARVLTALNRIDDAFKELNAAFERRSASVVWIERDPWLAPLKNDPRFSALIKKIRPLETTP